MSPPVTILGAGIVGICTALSLLERGVDVRLIDRAAPGQETSFGNAGVISPWSFIPQSLPGTWRHIPQMMWGRFRPLSVRPAAWPKMIPWGLQFLRNGTEAKTRAIADQMELLCAPSVDLFRRHLDGTGAEALIKDSLYVHAFRDASRANLQSLDYAIRREKGAALELIGADELRRLEPALSPDFKAAVLIPGQARATSPGCIGAVLTDKVRALGGVVMTDHVQRLERSDTGWSIQCECGVYKATTVVIAMGAWSAELLRPLGLRVPLMAELGYHVQFATPDVALNNSVMDVDAKVVASSMDHGVRVAGQAEFGAVDAPPDPRKKGVMTRLAKTMLPDLNTHSVGFWMGRRPSFPDSLPALGPAADQPGLYLNFGHSHYGLMMAPKSGELLADQVTGRATNTDLTALRVERFAR